ncbi:MAG TPA: malto-oligosyltrehalose trehalohydrolase [Gammaproteobacteria bacterium]
MTVLLRRAATQRRHEMPFGTEVREDGAVRFALWAPAVNKVKLALAETTGELLLPMERNETGWFTLVTPRANPGSRYRFIIEDDLRVPDPAARFQPEDVHGHSQVIDPLAWQWRDEAWRGRPWEEAVIYELHVGTFTPEGTFAALQERLDYLVELGITAIELMPVADFPGHRNWGYDGVLLFAPDSRYGTPADLKALIETAHHKGLMVLLDVVYNHFGPEGNYLHAYAPLFFTERHHTPWGTAINFDGPGCETVRQFYIHNALYWLEEYHLDGLRLDAVHAIMDDSAPDFLEELAAVVKQQFGETRHIHLILENDHNAAHYLQRDAQGKPRHYAAQWNEDLHHVLHHLLTGETDGYYADYVDRPIWYLGRCLAEGFAYQGEPSPFRHGALRGEPSGSLPPTAFVSFLQNHDQVGNRAFGERIASLAEEAALRAAVAILLLAPSPPLLFMGEEFGARLPFLFFCDLGADLAEAVTQGRRNEFAHFKRFSTPEVRDTIPAPTDQTTFERSKLAWCDLQQARHLEWFVLYQTLLRIRQAEIVPRLANMSGAAAIFQLLGKSALKVQWTLGDGSSLTLLANLSKEAAHVAGRSFPAGTPLHLYPSSLLQELPANCMPPWSVAWFIKRRERHAR